MRVSFSSHNVLLPDGTQTAPGKLLVAESGACQTALRHLGLTFGDAPREGISVADLGCLEGGYAVEFARAGYDVTGFEVRPENYDNAVWLGDALGLPNLRFVLGDVWETLADARFHAVFCCGLLYHLDRPVAFLKLLGQVTRRVLILNTHYSLAGGHPEDCHRPGEGCRYGPDEHEGLGGHWFQEIPTRWSSWGNTRSFWPRKDDLVRTILDAGFTRVQEEHDWRGAAGLPYGSGGDFADRGMFIAHKEAG